MLKIIADFIKEEPAEFFGGIAAWGSIVAFIFMASVIFG